MNDLKDKVVLITGAGKGAGRALAESLAERGAIIAANDISPINVEEVVAGIKTRGGKAKAYVEDVAKKVAVQALINNVEDEFGRIDGDWHFTKRHIIMDLIGNLSEHQNLSAV